MRLVLVISVVLAVGCSGSDGPSPAAAVSDEVLVERLTTAIELVDTMRGDFSIVSSYEDQTAVLAHAEAAVDFTLGVATLEARIDLDPGQEGGEETEETVVLADRAFRRTPGRAWEPTDATLTYVVFGGLTDDETGVADGLRSIVLDRQSVWMETTDGDLTMYVNHDVDRGEKFEIDVDGVGHITRIARSQPPSGIDATNPIRVGTETIFSDFDSTQVELPTDLPPN